MAVFNATITHTGSAIAIIGASGLTTYPAGAMARRVEIEPLRANTHASYVGLANVNSGGDPSIQELATPAANVILDKFLDVAAGSSHNIDPTVYYVIGTSSEKVKVTVWTI